VLQPFLAVRDLGGDSSAVVEQTACFSDQHPPSTA